METRKLLKIIIVLSIVGMAVDTLLSYNKITDSNVACEAGGGCDIVAGSIYSEIGDTGIPVSFLGFGAFLLFGILSAGALKGKTDGSKGDS